MRRAPTPAAPPTCRSPSSPTPHRTRGPNVSVAACSNSNNGMSGAVRRCTQRREPSASRFHRVPLPRRLRSCRRRRSPPSICGQVREHDEDPMTIDRGGSIVRRPLAPVIRAPRDVEPWRRRTEIRAGSDNGSTSAGSGVCACSGPQRSVEPDPRSTCSTGSASMGRSSAPPPGGAPAGRRRC
jgi:hypothetical protein